MKRLLDDPAFSAELRGDLLRSRSAGQDYQTAAKLLQLRAAFSDSAPAARPGGALRHGLKHAAHPGWKLAVLAALGGGAGLFAYSAFGAPAQRASDLQPTAAEAPLPPAAAAAVLPPPAAEAVLPPPAAAAPGPKLTRPRAAPAGDEPTAVSASRRIPEVSSSRREIAQLVRMRALLERDPVAAYRLAQRSEREFPQGVLAEERQALAIVALAKSGAKELAAKHARRFFARYPQSPLRASVEAALQR